MPEGSPGSTDPGARPTSTGAAPEGSPEETIELGTDWVEPPKAPKSTGPGARAGAPDELNEDVLRGIVHSAFNVPSAIWGPHLVRTEAQIEPVVAPLQVVIKKYNINLMDWLPEALLALGLIGTVSGMYVDHQKHLATREDQPEQAGEGGPGQPPASQEEKTGQADRYFDRTLGARVV